MATQSAPPPYLTDVKAQDSAPELVQPTVEDGQDASKAAATKESSATSVFVNSEPMREDQVQNAVKFLSHPRVRGSPVIYRRSFLEKKGLTKEEIDEAFRLAPDPPPTATSVQTTGTSQDGQLKSASNIQPQVSSQITQAVTAAPVMNKAGILTWSWFHWSHAFVAIGLLAASGAGTAIVFKKSIVPRLKSWILKVVLEEDADNMKTNLKPSLAEETAAAAKAAAAAASDVSKVTQEMLLSKHEERRYFEKLLSLLDVQRQEMKSMSNAIHKLEGQNSTYGRIPLSEQEDHRGSVANLKQSNVNGKADFDTRSGRSSPPPASVESTAAPHPKSYMDIMAMVQRGEKPSNIRDINDLPPNPNQQFSNPRLAPRTKPWEVPNGSSNQVLQSQSSNEGFYSQTEGENTVPWWQQKNARITEIENEDEFKTNEQRPMVQRTWVPPQPPPIVMPEAAAAIRQPKSLVRKEQSPDDQLTTRSSDGIDELQRVTKISESGGAVEINGGSSGEIVQEEYSNEGN